MVAQDSDAPDFSGSGPVDYRPVQTAPQSPGQQVLARREAWLLALPGVTSVGIGPGPGGGEVLTVGVTDAGAAPQLPAALDGLPVTVVVTGPVNALPQR
jgi:hypothetical protein